MRPLDTKAQTACRLSVKFTLRGRRYIHQHFEHPSFSVRLERIKAVWETLFVLGNFDDGTYRIKSKVEE